MEEPFATFHLSASLPGVYRDPCPITTCGPESGSAAPEDFEKFQRWQCPRCQSNDFLLHQCRICSSFQEQRWEISPDGRRYISLGSLPTIEHLRASAALKSSRTGKCEFCPILLECLERCFPPTSLLDKYWIILIDHRQRHDRCTAPCRNRSLCVEILDEKIRRSASIEIFTLPGNPSPWTTVGEAHCAPLDTASEASLAWTKDRLRDCLKSHVCCNVRRSLTMPFPKRLIDVLNDRRDGPVRLIDTFGQKRQYLSLSHCWGNSELHPQPLKTTDDNLHQHLEGIPWSNLPRTFQDAVNFVRSLGEKYIWIDSLCIIQDSTEDWREESAKMASIYEGSLMTIATTKSPHSMTGCFSTPDDGYKPLPFSVQYSNGSCFTMCCRRAQPHLDNPLETCEDGQFALLHRAWFYQERHLSPRTLHFGYQELSWECREKLVCECDYLMTQPSSSLKLTRSFWPTFDDRSDPESSSVSTTSDVFDTSEGLKNVVKTWHNVVEKYSQLSLSKASDRLPAIAGVAKVMQTFRRDDEYLAGLWRSSLFEDLIWETRLWGPLDPREGLSRDTSLAPSWSWACMDEAPVSYCNPQTACHRMASLLEAETRPDGPDVYLKVPSGALIIKGYLFCPQQQDFLFPKREENHAILSNHRDVRLELILSDSGLSLPNITAKDEISLPQDNGTCKKIPSTQDSRSKFAPMTSLELSPGEAVFYPDCKLPYSGSPDAEKTTLYCLWTHRKPREIDQEAEKIFVVLRQKKDRPVYERVGKLLVTNQDAFALPPASEQAEEVLLHTITLE
ncbi:heterokaryon incompatibility protein-domain-containing protein [Phyllosticta capitalensis]